MTLKNFPDAATEIRQAVRESLAQFSPADLVLVACSGGTDSLALAKAAALEADASHVGVGAIVVDHGWATDSDVVCGQTAHQLEEIGLAPVIVEQLASHEHKEAIARDLRYEAFARVAREQNAAAIMLAHTKDDQAETVLMRLARGSGATSLAGMPPRRDIYFRPLLHVTRTTTKAACAQWGLEPWHDPANEDLSHARIRVRKQGIPALVDALGPSVIDGLTRSADLLRDDANLLDRQSKEIFDAFFDTDSKTLDAEKLAQEHPALTRRVLLQWVSELGANRSALNSDHLGDLQSLVSDADRNQRVSLPGGFVAFRKDQTLHCVKV